MAEDSMKVFFEPVGESIGKQETSEISEVRLECAQAENSDGENEEEDASFESAVTLGDIEIIENDLFGESGDESPEVSQTELMNPTETLQEVLRDSQAQSSDLSIKEVKQEPEEDITDHLPLHMMGSDGPIPVSLTGPRVGSGPWSSKPRPGRRRTGKRFTETNNTTQSTGRSCKKVLELECFVCGASIEVTFTNDLTIYPFCENCVKAYTPVNRGRKRKVKKKCPSGGFCEIKHDLPNQWCNVCHNNKFTSTLKDLNLEFDFDNQKIKESYEPEVRKKTAKSKGGGQTSLMNDALENSSSVHLQRLSAEQLADYGIELEDDLLELDGNGHSSRKSPSKCRPLILRNAKVSKKSDKALPEKPTQNKETPMEMSPVERRTQKSLLPKNNGGIAKKRRKILMEHSPTSSGAEDEIYTLPAVNAGHSVVRKTIVRADNMSIKQPTAAVESENDFTEILESVKVYVFTCGHACGLCNSSASVEWLKESGFHTTSPLSPSGSHTPSHHCSTSAPSASVHNQQTVTSAVQALAGSEKDPISTNPASLSFSHLQNVLESGKSAGGSIKVQMAVPPKQPSSMPRASPASTATTVVNLNGQTQSSHQQVTPTFSSSKILESLFSKPVSSSPTNPVITTNNSAISSKPITAVTTASPTLSPEKSPHSLLNCQNVVNISKSQVAPITKTDTVFQKDTSIVQKPATLQNSIPENTLSPSQSTKPTTDPASVSRTITAIPLGQLLALQKKGFVLTPIVPKTASGHSAASVISLTQTTTSGKDTPTNKDNVITASFPMASGKDELISKDNIVTASFPMASGKDELISKDNIVNASFPMASGKDELISKDDIVTASFPMASGKDELISKDIVADNGSFPPSFCDS